MEKNLVYWIMGVVVVAAVFFNLGEPTGNVVKVKPTPLVTVENSPVTRGFQAQVHIRDAEDVSQQFKVYDSSGEYTGNRFFARASRCGERKKRTGTYDCDLLYKTTPLSPGVYHLKARARNGEIIDTNGKFKIV
jgi:hypothetical protein